ncbi:GFA family protein [Lonsdalea quercina]|uniref:GFA family protein n=1 Tax=Lonsdalea quercina TaxID=71657 RepID=UPI0039769ACB
MEGHCLCGAVTLSTECDTHDVSVCHCSMCQTWSGGPLMSIDCKDDLVIDGKDFVAYFRSSAWAERAFCRQCDSHLFYKQLTPVTYFVPVGLFGSDENTRMVSQIYIDKKPRFYAFTKQTPEMTEQDILDSYQSQC